MSSWIMYSCTAAGSKDAWLWLNRGTCENIFGNQLLFIIFAACCPFFVRFEPWEELSKWYLCYLFGGLLSSCLCPINPGHWRLVTQINTQISVKLQEYKLLFSPHSTPAHTTATATQLTVQKINEHFCWHNKIFLSVH